MSTQRGEAPALHRRGLESPTPDRTTASSQPDALRILHESAPISNVFARRRPSRIVPALLLGFVAFSICYLAGQVLAAITGWHWMIYVGVGAGLWLVASCFVAFCLGAVCGDD